MTKVNKQKHSDTENLTYNQHGERLAILNTENIKICGWITKWQATKNALCLRFLPHLQKIWIFSFPSSVATYLRWGGYCHMLCVANFILFPAVQKFWKSVKIWQSYRQLNGGNFLRHSVYTWRRGGDGTVLFIGVVSAVVVSITHVPSWDTSSTRTLELIHTTSCIIHRTPVTMPVFHISRKTNIITFSVSTNTFVV